MIALQPRAPLPVGVLTLEDGRLLHPFEHPTPFSDAVGYWAQEPDLRLRFLRGEDSGFSNSERKRLRDGLFISADCVDWGEGFGPLLHVCVSYPDRIPPWEDIRQVRYAFYPHDIDVMMLLPRDGFYVNKMPYCMQMYECPTMWTG